MRITSPRLERSGRHFVRYPEDRRLREKITFSVQIGGNIIVRKSLKTYPLSLQNINVSFKSVFIKPFGFIFKLGSVVTR